MELEMTTEEIQRNISAAFDSVTLVEELELISNPTNEEVDKISRNKEHLSIMMGKTWFAEALTSAQTTKINNLID